ncbi:MAG: coenzyme synthetase-like protein [Herbinix sp.]|jgi:phenylacetate-CoA ligase|nr:coenzyme synthetase-like protein [Herbinix sp.]
MSPISLEYADVNCVSSYQNKQISILLNYLNKYSLYYKKLFKNNNIHELDCINVKNFHQIPITKKNDLTANNNEFFCVNLSDASEIVSTSGSTSIKPIIHPLTRCDVERLTYNEKVSLLKADITNKELVMLMTAFDGSFIAGLAYYMGLKEIGAGILRAGSRNSNLQYDILLEYPVTTIVGVPSNILDLYEFSKNRDKDIITGKIKKMVLIGEAIRDENLELNQLGKRLSEYFHGTNLYSTYANTETCTSFCECDYHMGGHLSPELAYAEITDDEGNVLPDCHIGHLIITTFGAQGMPMLRYDTGDITFIDHKKCRCGRTSLRIGPIMGRNEGICKIKGVTFNISVLGETILSIPEIKDYCIVMKHNDQGGEYLQIFYYTENGRTIDILKKLKLMIWEKFRVAAKINRCEYNNLLKMQYSRGSRKPVRYIVDYDEREGFV